MFGLTAATHIYLYRGVCDMRKSFDGLCGIIRIHLRADSLSGSLFVFVNRRQNMVKLLYWDRDGLVPKGYLHASWLNGECGFFMSEEILSPSFLPNSHLNFGFDLRRYVKRTCPSVISVFLLRRRF